MNNFLNDTKNIFCLKNKIIIFSLIFIIETLFLNGVVDAVDLTDVFHSPSGTTGGGGAQIADSTDGAFSGGSGGAVNASSCRTNLAFLPGIRVVPPNSNFDAVGNMPPISKEGIRAGDQISVGLHFFSGNIDAYLCEYGGMPDVCTQLVVVKNCKKIGFLDKMCATRDEAGLEGSGAILKDYERISYPLTIDRYTMPDNNYTICGVSAGQEEPLDGGYYTCSGRFIIKSFLDIPSQLTPVNGSALDSFPELGWSQVADATKYYVDMGMAVQAFYFNKFVLGQGQKYSWRVAACSEQSSFEPTTNSLKIGADPTPVKSFSGYIDDIRMYNRALSSDEISSLTNSNSPDNLVTNGLVGYWKLDDKADTMVTDSSGSGGNGSFPAKNLTGTYYKSKSGKTDCTYVGEFAPAPEDCELHNIYGPTEYQYALSAGKFGNAIKFVNQASSRANNYISIPSSDALNPKLAITISVWVKASNYGYGSDGYIISKQSWSKNPTTGAPIAKSGYGISTTDDKKIIFTDRGGTNALTSNSLIPIDQWTHIVVTGDPSGLKIYINGKLDASNTKRYGGDILDNCTNWSDVSNFTVGIAPATSTIPASTIQTIDIKPTTTTITTTNTNQVIQEQIQNSKPATIDELLINNNQQTANTKSATIGNDTSWCYTFTKTLKYKDTGYVVGALQAALKYEGLLNVPKPTTYFGPVTKNAVTAFQNKYRDDILAQYNLTSGTGFVGPATIEKLNKLYGCK